METTREKANEESRKATVNALNSLLVKNYDAVKGYKHALKDAKDERLKAYFKKQAAQRSQYANQLDETLRKLNATPLEEGSTAAALHRTWMDFKKVLSSKDDHLVLEECIRGDKAAVKEYQEVLDSKYYLDEFKALVSQQMGGIEKTLRTIKKLEDITD